MILIFFAPQRPPGTLYWVHAFSELVLSLIKSDRFFLQLVFDGYKDFNFLYHIFVAFGEHIFKGF